MVQKWAQIADILTLQGCHWYHSDKMARNVTYDTRHVFLSDTVTRAHLAALFYRLHHKQLERQTVTFSMSAIFVSSKKYNRVTFLATTKTSKN